jgi:glycosyltransferase involved in cell wall biosynthesis
MKIALYHNLPSGGAKRHTYEQVKELAKRGHELVEFAPSTADLSYCSFEPFVKRQRIFDLSPVKQAKLRIPFLTPYLHAFQGIKTLTRTAYVNRAIAQEIDFGNFDVVFVKDCHISMNPYVLRYLKTRSVFQCHHGLRHRVENVQSSETKDMSLLGKLKEAYYRPARELFKNKFETDEVRNIQSASLVLTNSEYSKQLISQHYQVNSRVVYPGINTGLFRPLSVTKLDYVLCVGALIYSKGYRFLVSALACIDAARRPKLFIAANSGHYEEEKTVRDMASRLGVDIHIEQIRDDQRLVEVYNQARAFVYAPIQEALGMAPLEAMACGTPVVAVGEGGIQETVLNNITGWTVPRDYYRFAERVESLLADDKTRLCMAQAGIEYVRSQWTWQSAVDKLEQQFRSVVVDQTSTAKNAGIA